MSENGNYSEFELFGCRVQIDSREEMGSAQDIVNYVSQELEALRSKRPGLSEKEVAVLTALKIAHAKHTSEQSYQKYLDEIELLVKDGLDYIDSQDSMTM